MSKKTLYEKHKRNHEEIVVSFDNLLHNLLQSIKRDNKAHIRTNTRLLLFLLGTYAETFLNSFIYESHYKTKEPYFTEEEIKQSLKFHKQEERWIYIIKVSMEKKFQKPYNSLGRVEQLLYNDLINTFKKHIIPIILLRNKIAHGNWIYIIKGGEEIIYDKLTVTEALYKENYLSLKLKKNILIKLKELLISLISSKNSISEDYNRAYNNIENIDREINSLTFKKFRNWEDNEHIKYKNGLKWQMHQKLK
jgi:hypothetical protein